MEKKLNLTQQKHAFINQQKCTKTQKLELGLVAFYDIQPGKQIADKLSGSKFAPQHQQQRRHL